MQRVSITARLNGTTLQFEEAAFVRLEAYLADAARTLDGNPDREEILADLEQAVADQCVKRLSSRENVVTLVELAPALEEIGSVQDPGGATTAGAEKPSPQSVTRPLQQVSEGALISGVCLGIARYLNADVTLVRLIAVLLLFVSGGAMIVVYGILMLLLPYAPAERGSEPIARIPAKTREWVEFLRSKFSTATG